MEVLIDERGGFAGGICQIDADRSELQGFSVKPESGGQLPFSDLFRVDDVINDDLVEGVRQLGDPGQGQGSESCRILKTRSCSVWKELRMVRIRKTIRR